MLPIRTLAGALLPVCCLSVPTLSAQDPRARLDEAVRDLQAPTVNAPSTSPSPSAPGGDAARAAPPPVFTLLDLSLTGNFAFGTSTVRDRALRDLQGGGHDPRRRGFTVQNVELAAKGAVDPYFTAAVYLISQIDAEDGETIVELEEASLTTTSLPDGFQVEAGHMFTEFGRHNPSHPHAWAWVNQPFAVTRMLGPDGLRGTGARIAWLAPTPFFFELHGGVQNANGETMASFASSDEAFAERPIGGRAFVERDVRAPGDLAWLLRAITSGDVGDATVLAGASVMYGPNATGPDADTLLYGIDLTVKWRAPDADRSAPSLEWQTEFVGRRYDADAQIDAGGLLVHADRLHDFGGYTQLLWGFAPRWSAGLRYGYADGRGLGHAAGEGPAGRDGDPFGDERHRVSPLLVFRPTEFSRLRLQYDFDVTEHLTPDAAHSFWLAAEFALGKHAAHRF